MKILLIIILSLTLIGCDNSRNKIYSGYNDEEKDLILSFGSQYLDYFTNDDKYQSLIDNPFFNSDNLQLYIDNYDLYDTDTLVYVVNNNLLDYNEEINLLLNKDGFILDNLASYIELINSYPINSVICIVNNDIFSKYKEEDVSEYLKNKYFIYENLDLYVEYKDYGTSDEVVTYVNTLNYKGYYIDTLQSDLSLGCLIQANKHYYLGEDYAPSNLVEIDDGEYLIKEASDAYFEMVEAAKNNGYYIEVVSGYRPYYEQAELYNNYVSRDGIERADTYSARPGYSDHQTGYTLDLTVSGYRYTDFKKSEAYLWMLENAYKYGFIVRYPEGKENITGYEFEAWHYRYVGKEASTFMHDNDLTFDEYYEYYVLRNMYE